MQKISYFPILIHGNLKRINLQKALLCYVLLFSLHRLQESTISVVFNLFDSRSTFYHIFLTIYDSFVSNKKQKKKLLNVLICHSRKGALITE